jgi:hypothetical protein
MRPRDFLAQRLLRGAVRRLNNIRIAAFARTVARIAPTPSGRPVAFFKASTGLDDLSWNSAFHLLASWALRLRGVPVAYFACNAGMSRCVLGTNRDRVTQLPPCKSCVQQARTLYSAVPPASGQGGRGLPATTANWFGYSRDPELATALQGRTLEELMHFAWPQPDSSRNPEILGTSAAAVIDDAETLGALPLGALCLPGLRWILRRHNLDDDEPTRFLLREYILSAWNVAGQFSSFLSATNPRLVVVFNGQFFPEAVARYVAQHTGRRVITHEVGLQPVSAFFTEGEATAYPIHIPDDFELDPDQNARLDAYLQSRFQGDFTMAGIQFWPRMRGLDQELLDKLSRYRQLVPIFTNVIFDTSQPHANGVFPDMFAWLDATLEEIRSHPDTLFVIRAHPDETRLRKESREKAEDWVDRSGAAALPNVVFIAPKEDLSSYELIERSKLVLVYNSTIGLEASILGVPVLCGGRARFTQYPIAFFPQTTAAYVKDLRSMLASTHIEVPVDFKRNARRFLYYQLFRTSLPFGRFLEPSVRKTQARLRAFTIDDLLGAPAVRVILDGVLDDGDFLLPESEITGTA